MRGVTIYENSHERLHSRDGAALEPWEIGLGHGVGGIIREWKAGAKAWK